jgi:serine/threonine protein kinase
MFCPTCQTPLPDDSRFCNKCGVATIKVDLKTTIKNSPDTDPNNRIRKPVRDEDPRIGLVLDSKYQLLERLGQGGMGCVYRARRLHIGDEVAVKLLSHELLRDNYSIERFRREAQSAAMIRHPNVVTIHDFSDGTEGDPAEAYIVMELVRGESLRGLLEREGRLSPERAINFMRDICAGVGVAHRQGLLHRDLKPDNVIISPPTADGERETAKVVDFGLAKIRDENVSPLTETGSMMGTIYYMSPEQCRGEELDARADVYSLGAMLYEMLAGRPPFRASNITGLIAKHLSDPIPAFDPSLHIPTPLATACFQALAKRREERQPDATGFAKTLQESSNYDLTPSVLTPRKSSSALKWILAVVGLGILTIGVVVLVIGIKLGSDWLHANNPSQQTGPSQPQPATTETPQTTTAGTSIPRNLSGTWTGTYGPLQQTATLTIENYKGNSFEGVLEQGETRVAFEGTIDGQTLHMKQLKILSGSDWSLGEDTGTISSDGKRMTGTGKDAMGGALGISYPWTFSR